MSANPSALDPVIVTDLALTLLGRPRSPETHVACPGCDRLVHHSERSSHARSCADLRALATPPSLAPRTP